MKSPQQHDNSDTVILPDRNVHVGSSLLTLASTMTLSFRTWWQCLHAHGIQSMALKPSSHRTSWQWLLANMYKSQRNWAQDCTQMHTMILKKWAWGCLGACTYMLVRKRVQERQANIYRLLIQYSDGPQHFVQHERLGQSRHSLNSRKVRTKSVNAWVACDILQNDQKFLQNYWKL